MNSSVDLDEPIPVVEPATFEIVLEDRELEVRTSQASVVHQGAADAPALMIRVHEDATDLVADQRQEADDPPIRLGHRGLRYGEPVLRDLTLLGFEELRGEKPVGDHRGPVPDIEDPVQIVVSVGPEHL
jgi:hypothetical protein